jgi:hypothetical protein
MGMCTGNCGTHGYGGDGEAAQVYDPRKVRKLTEDDLLKTYW